MNGSMKHLRNATVACQGEEVAKVTDILFDDSSWTVAFLVVALNSNHSKHLVVVPPRCVSYIDWTRHLVELGMNHSQLEECSKLPDNFLLKHKDDVAHHEYFKWPFFWTGAGTFGVEGFPDPAPVAPDDDLTQGYINRMNAKRVERGIEDHGRKPLRLFSSIQGYKIHADNALFGVVEDFAFDDSTWKIRDILVDSKNWWNSKLVKLAPKNIEEIAWDRSEIVVRGPKEKLIGADYVETGFSL